ncbi:MAG TPA: crosslink repair DNA glycosylase YcaQ family protein [Holophaga sp.]|nr:crosslink repair DNA glycosylase YcaQ family protein [Holophaga sp.]
MPRPLVLTADRAARLFLGAQGLLEPPDAGASPTALRRVIEALGFVQVDSIQAAGRAQDLILHARLAGYREGQVWDLLRDRSLFEGFTHDASLVPVGWYPHWRPRWRRDDPRIRAHPWWRNLLGPEADRIADHVLARIQDEGPLGSADFDHPGKRGSWWGWKPQKAALDHLWRTGRLAVVDRIGFQKRYDLPERVYPEAHGLPEPSREAHLAWACGTAAERLLVFTPRELAAFWACVDLPEARAWCATEQRAGRIIAVRVEGVEGSASQEALALADLEDRLEVLPEPWSGVRLLAPFDPLVRDRARCLRRFGFDYRFEAFTPEAKRQYGYYTLPILEGDRLVGRLDPRLHRGRRVLEVRGLWWEPGIRPTKVRRTRLEAALARLAGFLGAERVEGSE